MTVKIASLVLLVDDVARSKSFYAGVLGQKVLMDIQGINVAFEGGLGIWERKYAQENIFGKETGAGRKDAVEVYFETEELEAVYERLSELGIPMVHPLKTQPWQQRGFRVYDPDGFVVEIAETMACVVGRLFAEGLSADEVARRTFMPREAVEEMGRAGQRHPAQMP